MTNYSIIAIITAIIFILVFVSIFSLSNFLTGKVLSKFSIKNRIRIDNISLILSGILIVYFIFMILSSSHVFDNTYFKNQYDYGYRYETIDGGHFYGEFDMYKNIGMIETEHTKLYIMAFRDFDGKLSHDVYYKIKVITDVEYNYSVSSNNVTYYKLYSSSSDLFILDSNELSLFVSDGDIIKVSLMNEDLQTEKYYEFEHDLSFYGFKTLPVIPVINTFTYILMLAVFVLFIYLIFKKIHFLILNHKFSLKPIISSIIISIATIIGSICLNASCNYSHHIYSSHLDLNESNIYLEETVSYFQAKVEFRYNYLTDKLYFKTKDMNKALDITFDDTRYISTRSIHFGILELMNDGWYTIDNVSQYSVLKITLYDFSDEDVILLEEEFSLKHPLYE